MGPWKASEACINNAPNLWVITDGKWGSPTIAEVDSEAHAHLIAAAPELLAALGQLVFLSHHGLDKVSTLTLRNAWIRAIGAIAKAEGK